MADEIKTRKCCHNCDQMHECDRAFIVKDEICEDWTNNGEFPEETSSDTESTSLVPTMDDFELESTELVPVEKDEAESENFSDLGLVSVKLGKTVRIERIVRNDVIVLKRVFASLPARREFTRAYSDLTNSICHACDLPEVLRLRELAFSVKPVGEAMDLTSISFTCEFRTPFESLAELSVDFCKERSVLTCARTFYRELALWFDGVNAQSEFEFEDHDNE